MTARLPVELTRVSVRLAVSPSHRKRGLIFSVGAAVRHARYSPVRSPPSTFAPTRSYNAVDVVDRRGPKRHAPTRAGEGARRIGACLRRAGTGRRGGCR